MRTNLPATGPLYNESAIVILDDSNGAGTHWVAYRKRGRKVTYFDSFGDLRPPQDLLTYLNVDYIKYNYSKYQNFGTYTCGHLCLKFLCNALKTLI